MVHDLWCHLIRKSVRFGALLLQNGFHTYSTLLLMPCSLTQLFACIPAIFGAIPLGPPADDIRVTISVNKLTFIDSQRI